MATTSVVPAGQAQRSPAVAVGTSSISGRVVGPVGDPLVGVRVSLRNGSTNAVVRETYTDSAAQFAFPRIPAATYLIEASSPPLLPTKYGQKKPDRAGTPVAVTENESRPDLVVRMFRGAVIGGRISGDGGMPLVGFTVQAFRVRYGVDGRAMDLVGTAVSDDRGEYRIFNLAPGDYIARAVPPQPETTVDLNLDGIQPPRTVGYRRVFYPGTPEAGQAVVLGVQSGDERLGTDFMLARGSFAIVRGRLSADRPVTEGLFWIVDESGLLRSGDPLVSAVGSDGRFVLHNVPSGTFTVQVRSNIASSDPASGARPVGALWGTMRLSVDEKGLSGLAVLMRPGSTIAGRIKFEGKAAPISFGEQAAVVVALPAGPTPLRRNEILSARVDPTGHFSISGLPDGPYHIDFSTQSSWQVASIAANGRDVAGSSVQISGGDLNDVVITLTDQSTSLSGSVTAPQGSSPADYTLVVFPADPGLRAVGAWTVVALSLSTSWQYSTPRILPGEYLVAITDDIEPGGWLDPRVQEALAVGAARIKVALGARAVLNLSIATK